MKKFLSLLVLLTVFTSCEDDVKFNTPAVQGLKDNELWKANKFTAIIGTDNSLTVTASNGIETVVLKTASFSAGTYILGADEVNKASYTLAADGIEENYQTGSNLGSGQIVISDKLTETDINKGFITGTFSFNGVNDAGDIVYFQEGYFYKVKVINGGEQ